MALTWRLRGAEKAADYAASTHRSRTRNSEKSSRNGVNAPANSLALGIDQRSKPKPCAWSISQLLNSIRRSISPPARIGGHYRQLAERSVVLCTKSELAAFFLSERPRSVTGGLEARCRLPAAHIARAAEQPRLFYLRDDRIRSICIH